MRIYIVYDTYDNEIYVTRGIAKKVARVLGVTANNVRKNALRGSLIKRRYRVVIDKDG